MKNFATPLVILTALLAQGCSNAGMTPTNGSSSSSSSADSSSSSSTGDKPAGNVTSGAALFVDETLKCSACHADNEDGTFGVGDTPFFFDVNDWQYPVKHEGQYEETVSGLAAFIAEQMPPNDPQLCADDCATDIAAYLWSLRDDASSSSSSSSSSVPSSSSSSSSAVPSSSSSSSAMSTSSSSAGSSSSAPGTTAGVAEGQAFVSDIQRISDVLNSSSKDSLGTAVSRAFEGETATAVKGFLDQVSGSELLKKDAKSAYVLEALGKAGGAISEVLSSDIGGQPMPTDLDVMVALTKQNVGQGQVMTFTVNQTLNVCTDAGDTDGPGCNVDIDLVVVADFEFAPTGSKNNTSSTLASDGLTINLDGSLSNGFVDMTFAAPSAGEALSVSGLRLNIDESENGDSAIFARIQNLVMNLPVTLSETQAADPISVDLVLSGTSDAMTFTYASATVEEGLVTTTTQGIDIGALTNFDAALATTVRNASSESVITTLDLTAADAVSTSGVITTVKTCDAASACKTEITYETNDVSSDTVTGFLATLIPGLATSVDVSAVLADVDPVTLALGAAPQADGSIQVSDMAVAYGGVSYTVTGEFSDSGDVISLDATNAAGARILVESSAEGVRTGSVFDAMANQVGTISENTEGDLVITYTDGTTEAF